MTAAATNVRRQDPPRAAAARARRPGRRRPRRHLRRRTAPRPRGWPRGTRPPGGAGAPGPRRPDTDTAPTASTAPAAATPDQRLEPARWMRERDREHHRRAPRQRRRRPAGRAPRHPMPRAVGDPLCDDGLSERAGGPVPAVVRWTARRATGPRARRGGLRRWSAPSRCRTARRREPTVDYAEGRAPGPEGGAASTSSRPRALPGGWRATSVRFDPGPPQHWHLGVLTGATSATSAWSRATGRWHRWSRSTSTRCRARGAAVDVAGRALVDVHRRRGGPRARPSSGQHHHARGRSRRAPIDSWWPMPRVCASASSSGSASAAIAASRRALAPSSHSWQIRASCSPRSHSASDPSRSVPPDSSWRTTSTSSSRACS